MNTGGIKLWQSSADRSIILCQIFQCCKRVCFDWGPGTLTKWLLVYSCDLFMSHGLLVFELLWYKPDLKMQQCYAYMPDTDTRCFVLWSLIVLREAGHRTRWRSGICGKAMSAQVLCGLAGGAWAFYLCWLTDGHNSEPCLEDPSGVMDGGVTEEHIWMQGINVVWQRKRWRRFCRLILIQERFLILYTSQIYMCKFIESIPILKQVSSVTFWTIFLQIAPLCTATETEEEGWFY